MEIEVRIVIEAPQRRVIEARLPMWISVPSDGNIDAYLLRVMSQVSEDVKRIAKEEASNWKAGYTNEG